MQGIRGKASSMYGIKTQDDSQSMQDVNIYYILQDIPYLTKPSYAPSTSQQ